MGIFGIIFLILYLMGKNVPIISVLIGGLIVQGMSSVIFYQWVKWAKKLIPQDKR